MSSSVEFMNHSQWFKFYASYKTFDFVLNGLLWWFFFVTKVCSTLGCIVCNALVKVGNNLHTLVSFCNVSTFDTWKEVSDVLVWKWPLHRPFVKKIIFLVPLIPYFFLYIRRKWMMTLSSQPVAMGHIKKPKRWLDTEKNTSPKWKTR